MRHLIGIGLSVVTVLTMFFAGAWGYLRLLKVPTPGAALPADGGSLLSHTNVLTAVGAVAATGILAGILIAVPRVSPLAAGLPGLLLIGWTALYIASVRRAVELIPLRQYAFGAGWESLLFNGTLGGAGLAMVIPLFVPSRWWREQAPPPEDELDEARLFVEDLREGMRPADSPPV
jgi:hypothetical protein